MFELNSRLCVAADEGNNGPGGQPASEREAFGGGFGAGRAPERAGSISRSIEERALAHAHNPSLTFPEGHIAGVPGAGMDPGIPYRRGRDRGRAARAGSLAGNAAGTVARWLDKARNIREIGPSEARRRVEAFIARQPASLAGAALAGFLLGRLLRR